MRSRGVWHTNEFGENSVHTEMRPIFPSFWRSQACSHVDRVSPLPLLLTLQQVRPAARVSSRSRTLTWVGLIRRLLPVERSCLLYLRSNLEVEYKLETPKAEIILGKPSIEDSYTSSRC